jgi:transcription-repair coupling factor (superfamily II helicase)
MIAPIRAIMSRTIPRREFAKATRIFRPGHFIEPGELARSWVNKGYVHVTTVVAPGQFARRGGILDIWPADGELPTRLEFFGDEIDSFRYFAPSTQRTVGQHERLVVPPAREFLLTRTRDYTIELNNLSEFHIPILHPDASCFLDYLPDETLILIDDWETITDSVTEFEEQALVLRKDAIEEGLIEEDFPVPYLSLDQIDDLLTKYMTIEMGPAGAVERSGMSELFSQGRRFGGQLKNLLSHMNQLYREGEEVIVVSRQSARLQELWNENIFEEAYQNNLQFIHGSLADGFILTLPTGPGIHLLTDGEIFGWRRPQPRQRPRIAIEAPETPYVEFLIDDLVVHIDHGIGRYKGLVQRTIDGREQEYLCVEYSGGDQLYVPVHQADRLTRYIGAKGRTPSINRLGGVEWKNIKSRVKKAVERIAEDLLELYAKRKVAQGFAFSSDTPWQKELEASFPYIETEDQTRVIEEVKTDMEIDRPMDRLICGDVGYGKTEIALRAAFKAVMDGKQVAMLVPTTILAQQHFNTFKQRLSAFPVEVEMLSRFRTQQEQRDILFRLAKGAVDIVIGTHRLVQPDVQFKELGLVIIDEEQRFGVTHKEHLKKLRTEVDVLTMTATPIPRTLYMALTGVRDISTINTPPEERLPIITHVGPYSPRLVRQAIVREMERGGQVFFVHNRVQTIQGMKNRLTRLIPEVRISIAHGQMAEKALAKRMRQFTAGEIDVLLTTSIIESGLDIPNANTLIVDRADTFGLAQLYQLRGRVGRGALRAYAYFFRHASNLPSPEGRQRLETIAEYTQLGAGYSIAMRDLEIRGSGDILGTRQHGNIAAVGFHLYTRLLTQSVNQRRERDGLPKDTATPSRTLYYPMVAVDLPIVVSIPLEYVPDINMRLRLYRRLADIHAIDDVDALAMEFTDRFGAPPQPVLNMFNQLKVKILAERAELSSVNVENDRIVLRFPNLLPESPPRSYPDLGPGTRTGKNAIWISRGEDPDWIRKLIEALKILSAYKWDK